MIALHAVARGFWVLPIGFAILVFSACTNFDDHPSTIADLGTPNGTPSVGSDISSGPHGEPGSTGTADAAATGPDPTTSTIDLEDGGASTNVGTGDGTSGGIPGAAGLGATGNGVPVPAEAGTGDGTIIITLP